EMRERLRVGEIVDGDELDVGDALLCRCSDDLSSDAAEAVDPYANGHVVVCSDWSAGIADRRRSAKGHDADDPGARIEQRGSALTECGARGDDVIDEHQVRTANRVPLGRGHRKRARNVVSPLL